MNAVAAPFHHHGPALLDVADLRVNYGEYQAVKGVSFQVARGETLALVGESGCGKSTTAMAIMRLLGGRAELSGTVGFDGLDLSGISDPQMRGLRGPTDRPGKARARIASDLYYINNFSVWLDIRIIFGTLVSELRGGKGF